MAEKNCLLKVELCPLMVESNCLRMVEEIFLPNLGQACRQEALALGASVLEDLVCLRVPRSHTAP